MQSSPVSGHTHTRLSRGAIVNVVLVYAVFASLWILLSDKAVEWLFNDPAQITQVSMAKGWLFVAITSLLLYSLMHRWVGRKLEPITSSASSRRHIFLFVSLAVIITALTVTEIIHDIAQQKKTTVTRLQTVAEFKAQQIADWLRERQADADFIHSSSFLSEHYQRWQESGNLQSGEQIKSRLKQFCKDWRFTGVTLLNPEGKKLWGSDKAPLTIAPALLNAARLAAADRKVLRMAPYRDSANNLRLDFVVPILLTPSPAPSILLHVDMKDWLFPPLQPRPEKATDGETLMLLFDDNQAIYLNGSQGIINTSAKPLIPEATKKLLAAQLSSGEALLGSPVEGVDHLGNQIIGIVSAVPGTGWFLLNKINRSEFCKEVFNDVVWVCFAGLLSLIIIIAGFYLVRKNQQLAIAYVVQRSQNERMSALNLLATIADSSNDAIFAKDLEGRYILFNRAGRDFVGKQANEILGKDDRSIFPAEQAEMLMEIGRRVIAENRIHTQEEVLKTIDTERVFLATKGPLRDAEGNIIGIFGISRDITETKRVEKALCESEERFRLALDASNDGLWDWDLRTGLVYRSPRYIEITGYQPDEVTPDFDFFKRTVHPDDIDHAMETISAHLQGKTSASEFDYRLVTRHGQIKWMRGRGKVVERDIEGGPLRMIGTITDISSLKFIEEALYRQTEELSQSNTELERFNRSMVGRELDMIALKQQVNELSRQLGREPPFVLPFLDTPAPNSTDSGQGA